MVVIPKDIISQNERKKELIFVKVGIAGGLLGFYLQLSYTLFARSSYEASF